MFAVYILMISVMDAFKVKNADDETIKAYFQKVERLKCFK